MTNLHYANPCEREDCRAMREASAAQTPQELVSLAAKWREFAALDLVSSNEKLSPRAKLPGIALTCGAQATYTKCADELEAALTRGAVGG